MTWHLSPNHNMGMTIPFRVVAHRMPIHYRDMA